MKIEARFIPEGTYFGSLIIREVFWGQWYNSDGNWTLYIKLNDNIHAKKVYERALELDPDNKTLKKKLSEIKGN